MPLSIGTQLPPPHVVPPTRAYPYSYVEWVLPDGITRYPLTFPTRGYFATDQVAGLGSVPLTFTDDALPGGGSRVRSIRYEPRIVTIPLAVLGSSPAEYQALDDELEDAFSQTTERGMGMLRIVRADGTERRIMGYYQGGWDSGGGDDWTWNVVPVQIYCPDGFFYDPIEVVVDAGYSAGGSPFLDRYPRTSRSRVLGVTQVTNRGRVPAYPRWRIDGPYTTFEAILLDAAGADTDVRFTLDEAITLGEGRIVDTTPGVTTVTDLDGVPAMADLVLPGSTLFGLPRGTSGVRFAASGAGSGSHVEMRFFNRYKKA